MTIDTPVLTRAPLWRRAVAEFLGTGMLVTVVVGSGIAAQRLSTDPGLQLLENSLDTSLQTESQGDTTSTLVVMCRFVPLPHRHDEL